MLGEMRSTGSGDGAGDDGGGSTGDAGGDRLSALPDDLLHAIFSRLKAVQMVRTSVLSTRWRHLWRAVSCLDIDQQGFTGKPSYFNNFTSNLLRSYDMALLEDFRLRAWTTYDRWVRRAIGQEEAWPCRIKRLHLSYLNKLRLTDLASHVSSRRPALEDLQLEYCIFLLTSNVRIVSSSLKKLVVVGEYDLIDDEVFGLIIEAPALVSLRLGAEMLHFIVDATEPHAMPSLVDASIHLPMIDCYVPTTAYESRLLASLCNVTSLHLSHFGVMVLPDYFKFPVFENLKTLSLDECYITDDFMGLEPYLRNSPNLQKLILRLCKVLNYRPQMGMPEGLHKSSEDLVDFTCTNLRLSEIIYEDADASVHILVKFLVGMSRNLPNNKIELTEVDSQNSHYSLHS